MTYDALDTAILRAIDGGALTFSEIAAVPDVKKHYRGKRGTWRIVDRRLQALRKRGVVRFDGKRREWRRA